MVTQWSDVRQMYERAFGVQTKDVFPSHTKHTKKLHLDHVRETHKEVCHFSQLRYRSVKGLAPKYSISQKKIGITRILVTFTHDHLLTQ